MEIVLHRKSITCDYVFLLLSATMYGLAFLFSDSFWFLIFLYPFFFLLTAKPIGLLRIFLWSFCIATIHLFGICIALYRINISWFYIFGLLLYVPLSSCVIFFLTNYCFFWVKDTFFVAFFGLIAHQLWITYFVLFPFGRAEGYLLMNPVILLSNAIFTPIIQYYDLFIVTILFYLGSIMPILFYHVFYQVRKQQYILMVIILGGVLLFMLPSFRQHTIIRQKINNFDTKKIVILPLLFAKTQNITTLFQLLQDKINNIVISNKDVQLVILPEGAIDIPISEQLVDNILQEKLSKIGLLFGALCWKKNVLYNSCFFKTDHEKAKLYKKRHALPLTERSIFSPFPVAYSIKPSKNQHPLLKIDNIQFVPYICSEFFFNNIPDDRYQNQPIVLLCNDIWFSGIASYIQDLMAKTVKFKAKQWRRSILYVAYSRAFFVDPAGTIVPLIKFTY